MINCDRASIFVYDPATEDLTTILADSTDQISIPADSNSIAGEGRGAGGQGQGNGRGYGQCDG